MSDSVWVLGAAMTKVGRYPDRDLIDLACEAALASLADAGVTIRDVQVLAAGNQFECGTGVGQRIQQQIGQTGIPVYNVVNACATGATAVRTVVMTIRAGEADLGLVVGVEQMGKMGLLGMQPPGARRTFAPEGRHGAVMDTEGILGTILMPGLFAEAGVEYLASHSGATVEHFARVAEKNHAHSTLNPLSQYRKAFTLDEILAARPVAWPNTLPMCCPTGDGAAALVLVSESRLRRLGPDQRRRAVKISASVLATDPWVEGGHIQPDFSTVTRNAADRAYEEAGIGPEDLGLVELHDCFATAELLHYENLRLCAPGGAAELIESRATWRDGRIPVNVSGGLLSKGHPIGMTGVAGIFEIATHLRGEAGERQIQGAQVGLAHVVGYGWNASVHILEKGAA